MKNIALIGYGNIGKRIFNKSLKENNISINKILKKRITNLKLLNVKFFIEDYPLGTGGAI